MYLLIDEYHLNLATDPSYELYKKVFVLDGDYYTEENFSIVRLGSILKFFIANHVDVIQASYQSFFEEHSSDIMISSLLNKRLENYISHFSINVAIAEDIKLVSSNTKAFKRFFPFWKYVKKALEW